MYKFKGRIGNFQAKMNGVLDNSCEVVLEEQNMKREVLAISKRPDEHKVVLMHGTVEPRLEHSDIYKRDFIVFDTNYDNKNIVLDTDTGAITSEGLELNFMKDWDVPYDHESCDNAMDFCLEAIRRNNLFVYSLLTDCSGEENKWGWLDTRILAANLLSHLDNINAFEKVVLVNGEKFFFANIGKKEFQLGNAKKLRKVMGVPDEVREFIRKNKLEDKFSVFQTLSENVNDVKEFVEYLNVVKKLTKPDAHTMSNYIVVVADIMNNMEDDSITLRDVVGHLARDNWFYGTFGLPYGLATEWRDCLIMAKAANIKADKFPQNIVKYHRILQKNTDVLKNPRTEEFKEAVSMYSRLTKEMKKEGYIIRPPQSEHELVEEGNVLHHCVASYRDKIIDEKAIVLFCRKIDDPDTPLYTIELEYKPGDTSFSVAQFKKVYDADVVEPELLKMLNDFLNDKKYIIEGGKNLFRKERVFKAKKDENVAAKGAI